jgi:hypothetical protein
LFKIANCSVPNPNQGLNNWGGALGNVQAPWAFEAPAPASTTSYTYVPAPAPAPPVYTTTSSVWTPTYTGYAENAPAHTQTCNTGTTQIGNFANLSQGTVVPLATAAADEAPATTATSDHSESQDNGNGNEYEADGVLGGAAGRR